MKREEGERGLEGKKEGGKRRKKNFCRAAFVIFFRSCGKPVPDLKKKKKIQE